jgi:hypothetical protein
VLRATRRNGSFLRGKVRGGNFDGPLDPVPEFGLILALVIMETLRSQRGLKMRDSGPP